MHLQAFCSEFLAWCDEQGVPSVAAVQPLHVAAWIERQQQESAAPTVKARLAAIRPRTKTRRGWSPKAAP